jgi:hypothetical protein
MHINIKRKQINLHPTDKRNLKYNYEALNDTMSEIEKLSPSIRAGLCLRF